ncbi:ubiquinone biosynthesis accessory factor UbiJ [Alteromonas facilis]|uniref:ubiquinone biosynthesis accessory factor UbiJ n=1 Tax=Alteromonas facilis TaxID=2048004 RepID=UPI000C2843B8|nr:SCP2 sterol-binding domain-containing protein [Alteromonas facilis]
MPTAQVLHALAETIINPLIKLDPDTQQRLNDLKGKRLLVWLEELSWPVELVFDEYISIHECQLDWDKAVHELTQEQCLIKTSLATLPELKDNRKITQLIRDEKLDLCGDMQIAQQVSQLFILLSIDWEDVLSAYIGDVAAYQVVSGVRRFHHFAKQQTQQMAETLSTALIDEKRVAVHRLEVIHQSDQIATLRDDVERLAMRIQQMEQKQ